MNEEPSWLEKLWMEVQAEIDAEELAERMDTEPEESHPLVDGDLATQREIATGPR